MTTTTYQAHLPLRNHRIVTPVPLPPRRPLPPAQPSHSDLAAKLRRFLAVSVFGGWFCQDCQDLCERNEGEQGQPAHCHKCGSHRLQYIPPVHELQKEEV